MTAAREAMILRLPIPLKEQVRALARENKRSMTKEIELAVETHVKKVSA